MRLRREGKVTIGIVMAGVILIVTIYSLWLREKKPEAKPVLDRLHEKYDGYLQKEGGEFVKRILIATVLLSAGCSEKQDRVVNLLEKYDKRMDVMDNKIDRIDHRVQALEGRYSPSQTPPAIVTPVSLPRPSETPSYLRLDESPSFPRAAESRSSHRPTDNSSFPRKGGMIVIEGGFFMSGPPDMLPFGPGGPFPGMPPFGPPGFPPGRG